MKTLRAYALVLLLVVVLAPAVANALPSLPASRFEPSLGCGCHSGLIEDWKPSMHDKAISDPVYLYKLKQGHAATKGAIDPFCNACHSPIGMMNGQLKGLDHSKLSPAAAEGVTCDFCHQVQASAAKVGNTSQIMSPANVKRAQLTDPHAPHPAMYSDFHTQAAFCGSCHDVYHPAISSLLLEGTYTEWRNGPYAKKGIACQDCHMTPTPGVGVPQPRKASAFGPERKGLFSMTFAGGNVGLGDSRLAEQRLKAAATVALSDPARVEPGSSVDMTATVTNVGAGHYLPTGLTEVRQMWLDISAVEDGGNTLLTKRRDFGTVLRDAKGHHPVELWDAVAVYSDNRIPPQRSVAENATFPMGTKPVTVTATLYYRSASQDVAKAAGVELPTTQMAQASYRVTPPGWDPTAAQTAPAKSGSPVLPWLIVAVALVLGLGGAAWLFARRRANP